MLIDWFTVTAQAVNFLILIGLLKRFLYKPILTAIEVREKNIAAELKGAAASRTEAQKERDSFRQQKEALDQQHADLLRKATDEAEVERQRLLDEARKDSEAMRKRLNDAIRTERAELNLEIVTRTQQEVLAVARKALADLAGTRLEDRMADVFVDQLHNLGNEQQTKLSPLARMNAGPAVVRSAFELLPPRRAAIEVAARQYLGADTAIRFETDARVVSGIELTVDGVKIAWSIADYLASLAASVAARLESQAAATGGPAAAISAAIAPDAVVQHDA